jgi:hypothetical protein
MFHNLNMQRYFLQVEARKYQSSSSGGSTSVPPTSFVETSSIWLDDGGLATLIINVDTMSIESFSGPKEYAASDPRYIVEPVVVSKRSCETSNLVCNQLRLKHLSNPTVNLITLERLGIPKPLEIVDLSTSTNLSIIELSSDSGLPNFPEPDE